MNQRNPNTDLRNCPRRRLLLPFTTSVRKRREHTCTEAKKKMTDVRRLLLSFEFPTEVTICGLGS